MSTLLREQRFQLTGDARLQFWRETYSVALEAITAGLGFIPDSAQIFEIVRAAGEIADSSMAAHLTRNHIEFPDTAVDLWEQRRRGAGGLPPPVVRAANEG